MSIPTCAVRTVVLDSVGGQPLAGAIVSARLSSYEIYQGFVVPQDIEVVSGVDGSVELPLFPNELGSASSFYDVKIIAPNGKTLRTVAVVPNQETAELSEISEVPPYEGKPDAAVTISQVQALKNQTLGFRDQAQASAAQADSNAAATMGDREATEGFAASAASSAATTAEVAEAAITETGVNRAAVAADRAATEAARDESESALAAALAAGKVFDSALAAATSSSPVIAIGDTAWIRPNVTDGITKRIAAYKRTGAGTTIAAFQIDQNFATGDEFDAAIGPDYPGSPEHFESLDPAPRYKVVLLDSAGREVAGVRGTETYLDPREVFESLDPALGTMVGLDKDGRILLQQGVSTSAEIVAARGSRDTLGARLSQYHNAYGMPKVPQIGLYRLRRSRQKLEALAQGDNVQLVINDIGDSWVARRDDITSPLASRLIALYGDAGPGWTGMAHFGGTTPNGNARAVYTMARTGTWTDSYNNTVSPDLGSALSSTAGSAYAFTGPAAPALNAAALFWVGTADGVIRYRWNAGSWVSMNVQGSGLQTGALAGFPGSGAWSLDIEVVSGSVQLCGTNLTSAAKGVRWNKLGCNGSRAGHWTAVTAAQQQSGWAALGADITLLKFGTNDRTANITPSQYLTDMTSLVGRVRAAIPSVGGVPAGDILVSVPPQSTEVLTMQMADYAEAMRNACDALDVGFQDLQPFFGATVDSYSAWLVSDGRHVVPATGGRALVSAFFRALHNL